MTSTKTKTLNALTNIHITAQSGNTKTGNIPVTYRPMTTCANDCPFLPKTYAAELVAAGKRDPNIPANGGCYGTGRIFGMAKKFAGTVTLADIRGKLSRAHKSARFLRDRVVGDVMTDTGEIDHPYIGAIAELAREFDLVPFGYTHAWREFSRQDVAQVKKTGYVMNASCETRADIRAAIDLGFPITIASDVIGEGETFARPDGKTLRVVTCPAQSRENVTCADCGLCAKPERAAIVRFNIHGTAKKSAANTVAELENDSDHICWIDDTTCRECGG